MNNLGAGLKSQDWGRSILTASVFVDAILTLVSLRS